jgi:hypothetical protein
MLNELFKNPALLAMLHQASQQGMPEPEGTVTPVQTPPPAPTSQGYAQQAYAIPDAARRNPAFRTPDLLGLLGALALPAKQRGNFVGGYLGAKQNVAQDDTQRDQANVDRRRQALMQMSQATAGQEKQAFEVAQDDKKLAFDANQKGLDRTSREKISADDNLRIQEDQKARLASQEAGKLQQTLSGIEGLYQKAKTLPQMQALAKRYNSLQNPDLHWSDEQVMQDFSEKQRQFIDNARNDFGKTLDRHLNSFGEVTGAAAGRLAGERSAIAKAYGIPEDAMPEIPTGSTIKAQALKDRNKQFAQMFGLNERKYTTGLQTKLAELDLAERRLTWAQQHGEAMLGVSQGNLGVAQGNLQVAQGNLALRQYQAAQKGVQVEGAAALKKLDGQLSGIGNQLKEARKAKDDKKIAALESTQAKLHGQRSFLVDQLPPELQGQDALKTATAINGVLGGGAKVNPVTHGKPSTSTKAFVPSTAGNPLNGQIRPIGGYNSTKGGTKFKVIG